jgi:hypothetical protein
MVDLHAVIEIEESSCVVSTEVEMMRIYAIVHILCQPSWGLGRRILSKLTVSSLHHRRTIAWQSRRGWEDVVALDSLGADYLDANRYCRLAPYRLRTPWDPCRSSGNDGRGLRTTKWPLESSDRKQNNLMSSSHLQSILSLLNPQGSSG